MATSPPTPHWIGIGADGGMIKAISVSGKPSAVITTAAYTAPEAPREGRMSAVTLGATAAAVGETVFASAAGDVEAAASWATRRGYLNLADMMWDTRPENMPAG